MFHYLYKTTNMLNGMFYVGIHKTKNLNDGYMGSSKELLKDIKQHGLKNFKKEIIEYFGNYEDALAKEKEVVNEDFLNRRDTYNKMRGGHGGFDYINNHGLNDRTGSKRSKEAIKKAIENRVITEKGREAWRKNCLKVNAAGLNRNGGHKGPLDSEHKKKIRESVTKWWKSKRLRP